MTEAQLSTTIIENPEMLKYQQRQQQQQMEQKNSAIRDVTGAATAAPKVASMVNGESLEDIRKVGPLGWWLDSIKYKANTYQTVCTGADCDILLVVNSTLVHK